ncbi:MAG: hypothetical protein WCJ54_08155, partial [Actinomycetota bacterium]
AEIKSAKTVLKREPSPILYLIPEYRRASRFLYLCPKKTNIVKKLLAEIKSAKTVLKREPSPILAFPE